MELNPDIRFFRTEMIFKKKVFLSRNYRQELEQLGLPREQSILLERILKISGVFPRYSLNLEEKTARRVLVKVKYLKRRTK
jgi:hypothetical protein